jgi:hypothetical protein
VKKFTSRKAAVARIWEAVRRLSPDVAPQAEHVTPAKGKAKKSPAKAARRVVAQKGAQDERSNKKAEVIAMMKRAKGTTLAGLVAVAMAACWSPVRRAIRVDPAASLRQE